MTSTTARGYGWEHQKARKAALASFTPGQPCARCSQPMLTSRGLELDHDDHDRTRYIGLSHAACNRSAGGRKAHGTGRPLVGWPPTSTRAWSRDWENDWGGSRGSIIASPRAGTDSPAVNKIYPPTPTPHHRTREGQS